ncbi:glycosyl hydrolase family 61-domain-containing protein [Phialemonium atrogriseum]|uniref:lytic cellulose monooxygenase (C4-dehydrogenating) n=1 Tax=Phialemonium atrogriseum TaxID=1093897 RepID=A0AAJ0BYR8_9PEZI|nr:glycosyl hydrolase family 61-domain-containing protein [Phialemonium atrogriseum]KAK1766337.1 glycosyl hydrolase family 61-domain-containing protein [Phialemonium atrogriseum]
MRHTTPTLAAALAYVSRVNAHGHVANIVVNGESWEGYDPTTFIYFHPPPTVIGWTYDGEDNGFIASSEFSHPDIICHRSATPGGGHAVVAAGSEISLQWEEPWPRSHHGPVLDYLANCHGPCEEVDKTQLEFFKIDGAGYSPSSGTNGWASDTLIANHDTWLVRIPADLAPGDYVLRHEIIALHEAPIHGEAQAYPQCLNLRITGSGSLRPEGIPATELYTPDDEGIHFDIYDPFSTYPIPGPPLVPGAVESVAQRSLVATATRTAETGYAAPAAATTTAPELPTRKMIAPEPTTLVPTKLKPTTPQPTTPETIVVVPWFPAAGKEPSAARRRSSPLGAAISASLGLGLLQLMA